MRSLSVGSMGQGPWNDAPNMARFPRMKTSASDMGPMRSVASATSMPSIGGLHTQEVPIADEVSQHSQNSPMRQTLPDVKEQTQTTQWTDIDFPPLSETKGERRSESGVWSDKNSLKEAEESVFAFSVDNTANP